MLPRFSEQFHLSPDQFWDLHQDEFEAYLTAIKNHDAEMERQEQMYG